MSKKESAVDLAKFIDKGVRVKLAGGREGEDGGVCGGGVASPSWQACIFDNVAAVQLREH